MIFYNYIGMMRLKAGTMRPNVRYDEVKNRNDEAKCQV